MITGSTSSHAMATYTASAGAASATASQGRIPQNRTQAEKAQNTDSISLSDKSSDYSKSIADNKPYFPVREGMNADALVLGVANPGAVSSSKDKTFAEVATDARKRMAELNPTASARVASRLLEASDRQFWQPDPSVLKALREASEELEDRLEGVFEGAPA